MKALIFSTLFNLDIDCDAIAYQKGNHILAWKEDICENYFSGYENVKMRAIKHTSKKVNYDNGIKIDISEPMGGRIIVKQFLKNETSGFTQTTTIYAIEAFKEVWIARVNIKGNQVISPNDVIRKKINVSGMIGIENFPETHPQGSFIENNLSKGKVIYQRYLLKKPIIELGKQITAIFASGNIKLNVKAVAMNNGFTEDELIKIRLVDNGKIFLGKIKDNETVILGI